MRQRSNGRFRSRRSGRVRLAAVAWLGFGAFAHSADLTARSGGPEPAARFSRDVKTFLEASCIRCHGAKDPEGGVSLHTLGPDPTAADLVVWQKVFHQLDDGLMPPEEEKQPTAAARQATTAWIRDTLRAGGVAFDEHKPLRPDRGNWVDHAALFSSAPAAAAPAPGRVWRLSPRGYRLMARQIATRMNARAPAYRRDGASGRDSDFDNLEEVDSPWELEQRWNFSDYSFGHRIGESEIEAHLRFCQAIVDTMNWDRLSSAKDVIAAGKTTSRDQARKVVEELFGRLLPVPAAADDGDRYTDFLLAQLAEFEPKEAISRCLTAILCRPELLYRIEEAAAGRGSMPPAALARAITQTLGDRDPDKPLQEAVAAGRLATRDDVRRELERLLADATFPKPRLVGFFNEFFAHPTAPGVFKCETTQMENGIGKGWSIDGFTRDADYLVKRTLEADKDVLRTLLTSREWFPFAQNARHYTRHRDKTLARLNRDRERAERDGKPFDAGAKQYKVEPFKLPGGPNGSDPATITLAIYGLGAPADFDIERLLRLEPVAMPADQRAGMLTQPAWLVAMSSNFDNHAIHRGRWIREKLLGGRIPDVPIGVDAKLPDTPEVPLRERMTRTREEYCWKCHKLMDPLGLPFEQFDHFGRHRREELVVDLEKTAAAKAKNPNAPRVMRPVPLDTTGAIIDSGDPRLDGPVKDPFELIARLAASERVEQVFVRHVFRYFVGRNETLADGPVLVAAHKAYRDSGGSMRALLATLLSSDAFIVRSGPEPDAVTP